MKVKPVQFLISSIQGSDFVQSFITVHCLIIVKQKQKCFTKQNIMRLTFMCISQIRTDISNGQEKIASWNDYYEKLLPNRKTLQSMKEQEVYG